MHTDYLWEMLEDTVIKTATDEVINSPGYAFTGLVSEVGELADQFKKLIRNDGGVMTDERRRQIKLELGDIFWYLQLMLIQEEFDIVEILHMNRDKLFARLKDGTIKSR